MFDLIFFIGLFFLIIATIQDIKRHEVDNWISLFLIVFGWVFILFNIVFSGDLSGLFIGGFVFILCFALMNLFYSGKVFGGGDAKLLLGLFFVFVGLTVTDSFFNVLFFVFLLMFSGAVYGLIYSLILFVVHFKEAKREFSKLFKRNIYLRYIFFAGVILLALSFIEVFFLFFSILCLVGPLLWVFGKSLEKVVMIKEIDVNRLREGDLLARDIRLNGKVIKSEWDGLSLEEIRLLRKKRKSVKIMDGLPFVPAFLMAFILYYLLQNFVNLWRIFL